MVVDRFRPIQPVLLPKDSVFTGNRGWVLVVGKQFPRQNAYESDMPSPSPSVSGSTFPFASTLVGDEFTLHLDLPEGGGTPHLLVYLDAHLPTGRRVVKAARRLASRSQLPPLALLGIGHTNSYFRKRNRDFVPPPRLVEGQFVSRRAGYGQAAVFHRCLQEEILPWTRGQFAWEGEPVLCGHSIGGLFALYALLAEEPVFEKVIALSPSVWLNRRSLLRIARARRAAGHQLSGKLYLAAGALEEFNLILPGMRAFAKWARSEAGDDWDMQVAELAWKNHFTVVLPGVEKGLQWLFAD
jgi:predicted alpha/beta superfamily hydrolase